MSAFGIEVMTHDAPTRFYVGESDVLWDWLMSDNTDPYASSLDWLIIPAPEGYAFHYGNAFPVDELKEADEVGHNILVWAKSPVADKADMLLETLKQVSRDEFRAEKIPNHRILAVRNVADIPRDSGVGE